jgi:hypothetical protein
MAVELRLSESGVISCKKYRSTLDGGCKALITKIAKIENSIRKMYMTINPREQLREIKHVDFNFSNPLTV